MSGAFLATSIGQWRGVLFFPFHFPILRRPQPILPVVGGDAQAPNRIGFWHFSLRDLVIWGIKVVFRLLVIRLAIYSLGLPRRFHSMTGTYGGASNATDAGVMRFAAFEATDTWPNAQLSNTSDSVSVDLPWFKFGRAV